MVRIYLGYKVVHFNCLNILSKPFGVLCYVNKQKILHTEHFPPHHDLTITRMKTNVDFRTFDIKDVGSGSVNQETIRKSQDSLKLNHG
jgi:hypothetical protein